MNSTVGPSFKVRFAEIYTCGFREQCTDPQKNAKRRERNNFSAIQRRLGISMFFFIFIFIFF